MDTTQPATRTPVSWQAPEGMTFEAWQEQFTSLLVAQASLPWLLGDCLNAGVAAFGEEHAQALPDTRWAQETLRGYQWVCEKVPAVLRRTALSFSHHKLVAKLEESEQRLWLDRAEEGRWPCKELTQAMKLALAPPAGEGEDEPEEPQAEILPPKARPTVEYHDADEDQLESLKRAWNRAGQETREQFLEWTEDMAGPVIERGSLA